MAASLPARLLLLGLACDLSWPSSAFIPPPLLHGHRQAAFKLASVKDPEPKVASPPPTATAPPPPPPSPLPTSSHHHDAVASLASVQPQGAHAHGLVEFKPEEGHADMLRLGGTKLVYDSKTGRFYEDDPNPIPYEDIADDVLLLIDRTLDTIEDVALHLRRSTERKLEQRFKKRVLLTKRADKIARVIILGTGWGGHAITKIIDNKLYEVVVVSPRNHFLFTPMLASSSVGTIEFRSITEPIRQANPLADYYEARCEEIFAHNRTIKMVTEALNEEGEEDTFYVPYDILVYAVGAKSSTFNTPGAADHCYFLKEVEDGVALRKAIIDRFERANMPSVPDEEKRRLLSFVVVGGGPTGIEFSGEFNDFLQADLKKLYPRLVSFVSFKIIQAGPTILPVFDQTLQVMGFQALQDLGIEVLLNRKVVEVKSKEIILDTGEHIPYGFCLWAAGTGPRELTKRFISTIPEQASSSSGKRGKLLVDPWMRVKGTNGTIVAVGDCCDIEGQPLPATGQVAAQEGAYVARLLNRRYNLTTSVPSYNMQGPNPISELTYFQQLRAQEVSPKFKFLNLGLLAYLGNQKALAQVQSGDALRLGKTAGDTGNLLWKSVYLVKQVSTRNRILVLFDWLKSKFFGRDISRF